LQALGVVGDICLRFYDAQGKLVSTPLHNRVIGMELEALKSAKRVVGVAGGERKEAAIRGALRGGWINVLITDKQTAELLLRGETARGLADRPAATGTAQKMRGKRAAK
jgi:DNA-binding transcriptional regulator LsrR (DeoR family)